MARYLTQDQDGVISRYLRMTRKPRRILDIACGRGWMSLPLQRVGLNVVGLDLSRDSLFEYRRLANGDVPLVTADAMRLPFAARSFDWVIAIECFEYFPQHREFLQAVNRVLVNGGLLIFDTLNRRSYSWRLKKLFSRPLADPVPNASSDEILRAAATHGFNIREATGYNWRSFKKESETTLRFDRWYQRSPRILVAATKTASSEAV